MILFAALLAVIVIAVLLMKLIAEAGDKRAFRDWQNQRAATPPHTYTDHNGTEGRWP